MESLQGKTAFITGGGGGIGGGIAQACVEQGMRVVLADIDLGHARAAAAEIGEVALAVRIDVTTLDSWAEARAEAEAWCGPIDVLCNNAGISTPRGPLEEVPPELFARVMAINVTGVQNGIVTFVPAMKARRAGHVVNTSSMNGLTPFGTFGAYSASKFAVLGLSDALRDELAPFGVGVSTLFPGLTRSRMSTDLKDGPAKDSEQLEALLPRMMDPVWSGRAVVKAILANEPYVVTHPDYRPILEARHAALIAAFGESAQPGYATGASATR
jgi:NAD(P)-dependent dehydrogenase (short-subunit alcohol dehydrogenase family)